MSSHGSLAKLEPPAGLDFDEDHESPDIEVQELSLYRSTSPSP